MHISAVIPARNEKYLSKTIRSLLNNASGKIEVIAVLDGYWPDAQDLVDDNRVVYIHYSTPKGMRNAINSAVNIARGEYIFKSDAHCMFGPSYDKELLANIQDNWIAVPRRLRLEPEKWEIIEDGRPPIDYMYLDKDLHGREWREKNIDPELKKIKIDDLMSSQGSCYFIKKSYYKQLELLDEDNYGTFANEFQEVGLKCWLSGGRVIVNKNTWYAHWHKDKKSGRGYSLAGSEIEKANTYTQKWRTKGWHKQTKPLEWLINKFKPVPEWR